MKHFDRAERRRKSAAMKDKARRIYPHDPAARLADHLANCSCHMCGHVREISGPPVREMKHPDLREEMRLAEQT